MDPGDCLFRRSSVRAGPARTSVWNSDPPPTKTRSTQGSNSPLGGFGVLFYNGRNFEIPESLLYLPSKYLLGVLQYSHMKLLTPYKSLDLHFFGLINRPDTWRYLAWYVVKTYHFWIVNPYSVWSGNVEITRFVWRHFLNCN